MAAIQGVGGGEQEAQDRSMRREVEERRVEANARAQALEADAQRWRNIESACAAACETLDSGFQNQEKIAQLETAPMPDRVPFP